LATLLVSIAHLERRQREKNVGAASIAGRAQALENLITGQRDRIREGILTASSANQNGQRKGKAGPVKRERNRCVER